MFTPQPAPGVMLANPNATAIGARMAGYVTAIRSEGRRKNTALAFDPKEQEYREFCDHVYPHDSYRYTINSDKCYKFMFYTAFRDKKATGRAKKKKKKWGQAALEEEDDPHNMKFQWKAYDAMAAVFEQNKANFAFSKPKDPIGKDTFNTYKAVIKSIINNNSKYYFKVGIEPSVFYTYCFTIERRASQV
jgi:hypothetical protein